MNYLVMEVHPAYAVVLDEEGRFLKAANLRYQVGDTVRDIVELRRPKEKRPALWKPLSGVAGLAACLCIVFFGYYQPNFTPYGALRIQINPDVELTLSRTDRVLELEGLNADGRVLIEGYDYGGKDREDVTEELVERAIDMGYLSGGETVSITVTSADADWQAREEQAAREDLEERYGETIVIQIGPTDEKPPVTEVVIPVTPPEPEPTPEPPPEQVDPPAAPDDTDDRPDSGGATGYQDTDYGPDADGITDYEDTDYGPYSDGVTDYEDRDDGDDQDDDDDDGNHDDDDDDGDDDEDWNDDD
ncbi:hypothetical protein H9X91_08755 [Oscillibacter valericigenes]|uniref:Anti-sigma factor RsgI-like middle domain-containing protein n=1 Tax=Oscillibacter valericigenes TaxID=351091 RepID=A0ABS2FV60_9FIRM|nr:hypothetical protein [Oscillibacter valericigenes]MBM6851522.1 hypothetical protein [Oscillibacter valericigenes]